MTTYSLREIAQAWPRLARRLKSSEQPRPAEILPMIRSVLVARGYQSVADSSELAAIPAVEWRAHGFVGEEGLSWRAVPWLPSWLDAQGSAPDEEAARCSPRRPNWRLTADRFYASAAKRSDYLSPGQKASVRAVSAARGGDAVICVLPTGSGKTDVILTRAIGNRPRQTCLIVPTTALALDLERRVRELTGEQLLFAYHGELTTSEKTELALRVREGTQWLIISSPEAACTVLARPLEVSATEGRLDLLAIDEAHIVAEWGDAFRPAFQTFAGLRRRLLDLAPVGRKPVTVMLTATLDDYGHEALRRLFPGQRELLISAQVTRPEPAWWMSHCATEEEKRERFLEACRHMPRPLIVYTSLHTSEDSTNVSTALSWLRAAGLKAIAGVAGGVSAQARQDATRGLRLAGDLAKDLDIIVATSAFGLGMDVPDVRGVIHLCVPESVDRLYQEVGRSGRDGRASVSMVLWTDSDAKVAQGMAEARLIGDEKAWKRWRSMKSRGAIEDGMLKVDLTAPTEDVTYPWSDANRYWNIQTLSAMDRARMISMEWPTPPDVPVDVTDEALQEIFATHRNTMSIRVQHSDLADEATFRQRFRDAQSQSRAAATASLESATKILDGLDTCVNRYLADHYRLSTVSGVLPTIRQCGGCPFCRARRLPPALLKHPVYPLFNGGLAATAGPRLRHLATEGRLCVWTEGFEPHAVQELVNRLVSQGVMALVAAEPWSLHPRAARSIWWEDTVTNWLASKNVLVPTLVRVDAGQSSASEWALLLTQLSRGPLTVVLCARDELSPFGGPALLRESWGPAYHIDHILRRL
ncbi:protein DpdF [Nonomuraea bangladeshensis]|uniref:DNA 3'-5' helicase n=1 Tax=Nonomuraea bangladeshensis TaxID=404385 RepID=A0ABV3H7G8_9ACTN